MHKFEVFAIGNHIKSQIYLKSGVNPEVHILREYIMQQDVRVN